MFDRLETRVTLDPIKKLTPDLDQNIERQGPPYLQIKIRVEH